MIEYIAHDVVFLGVAMSAYSMFMCVAGAYVAYRKSLVFYSLFCLIFIVLVVFQSVQIALDFEVSNYPSYLEHEISVAGYSEALVYVALTSTFFFLISLLNKTVRFECVRRRRVFAPGSSLYVFLYAYSGLLSIILVFFVVGLDVYLQSSRPGFVSGSTIFLVGLSPGIFPVLFKSMYGDRVSIYDLGLFLLVLVVTFTFSRIHAIAYILILAFTRATHHYRGLSPAQKGLPGIGRYLIGCVMLAMVALIFGAIRDALNYTDADVSRIADFVLENKELSLLSVERNYRVGVEAMSSLAGAMSTGQGDPWGSPWIAFSIVIRGFLQVLPGGIKPLIEFFTDDVETLYWYTASVLPPGIESAYVAFGYFGTVLFPGLLNAICVLGTRALAGGKYGPWTRLMALLMLMNLVFYMRGSWIVWIAFNVSYIAIATLSYKLIFKRFFKEV
ncbi:MAG: hypothetical protein QM639_06880 [Rhodocyclaceae bacterium]